MLVICNWTVKPCGGNIRYHRIVPPTAFCASRGQRIRLIKSCFCNSRLYGTSKTKHRVRSSCANDLQLLKGIESKFAGVPCILRFAKSEKEKRTPELDLLHQAMGKKCNFIIRQLTNLIPRIF